MFYKGIDKLSITIFVEFGIVLRLLLRLGFKWPRIASHWSKTDHVMIDEHLLRLQLTSETVVTFHAALFLLNNPM
jgi:hypothetical protein